MEWIILIIFDLVSIAFFFYIILLLHTYSSFTHLKKKKKNHILTPTLSNILYSESCLLRESQNSCVKKSVQILIIYYYSNKIVYILINNFDTYVNGVFRILSIYIRFLQYSTIYTFKYYKI